MKILNRPRPAWLFLGVLLVLADAGAADKVAIVNEGGIRDKWMLADGVKLASPGYPQSQSTTGDDVCVSIGYRIEKDGSLQDFTLLKGWSSARGEHASNAPKADDAYWMDFSQAAATALVQWRFKPRPEIASPEPVYTTASFRFSGKGAVDPGTLISHCRIADLPTLVADLAKANGLRLKSNRAELEQYQRSRQQQSMVSNPGFPGVKPVPR